MSIPFFVPFVGFVNFPEPSSEERATPSYASETIAHPPAPPEPIIAPPSQIDHEELRDLIRTIVDAALQDEMRDNEPPASPPVDQCELRDLVRAVVDVAVQTKMSEFAPPAPPPSPAPFDPSELRYMVRPIVEVAVQDKMRDALLHLQTPAPIDQEALKELVHSSVESSVQERMHAVIALIRPAVPQTPAPIDQEALKELVRSSVETMVQNRMSEVVAMIPPPAPVITPALQPDAQTDQRIASLESQINSLGSLLIQTETGLAASKADTSAELSKMEVKIASAMTGVAQTLAVLFETQNKLADIGAQNAPVEPTFETLEPRFAALESAVAGVRRSLSVLETAAAQPVQNNQGDVTELRRHFDERLSRMEASLGDLAREDSSLRNQFQTFQATQDKCEANLASLEMRVIALGGAAQEWRSNRDDLSKSMRQAHSALDEKMTRLESDCLTRIEELMPSLEERLRSRVIAMTQLGDIEGKWNEAIQSLRTFMEKEMNFYKENVSKLIQEEIRAIKFMSSAKKNGE